MSGTGDRGALLNTLKKSSPELDGMALLTREGLVVAASLPPGCDEARSCAVTAAVEALSDAMAKEARCGALEQVLIRSHDGNAVVLRGREGAVFCALSGRSMQLGLLFINAARALDTVLSQHGNLLAAMPLEALVAEPEPAALEVPPAAAEPVLPEPDTLQPAAPEASVEPEPAAPEPAAEPAPEPGPAVAEVLVAKPEPLVPVLSVADQEILASIRDYITPYIPALTDRFYEVIEEEPQMGPYVKGRVEALKVTHSPWLTSLFSGDYGAEFARRQAEIGQAHVRANIPPVFVAASMSFLRLIFPPVIASCVVDPEQAEAATAALLRLLSYSQRLIDDKYAQVLERVDQTRQTRPGG
jgi:predicted regulator of Ras-like GTPase activity (Roadblock/LC7/MglB family)